MTILKKISASVLALSIVSSAHATTSAKDRFYLGFDVLYNKFSLGQRAEDMNADILSTSSPFAKNGFSGGLFAGKRWGNWGAELGYTNFRKREYEFSNLGFAKGAVDSYNLYLDGNYYYGVTDSVDLVGSVGAGYLTTTTSGVIKNSNYNNDSKVGIRLGVGAQTQVSNNIAIRAMYRYQQGNIYLKNVSSLGVGLAVQF